MFKKSKKKIGRNEPCPCGSGKKYKKCCLNSNKNSGFNYFDIGALWNNKFISEKPSDYQKEFEAISTNVFNNTLKILGVFSINNIKDTEDFLLKYMYEVENQLKSIINKYNVYELYFWVHRIPPKNVFGSYDDTTIALYREILIEAIIKYGRNIDNFTFIKLNDNITNIVPDYIADTNPLKDELPKEVEQILIDCYKLEILSFLFIYATQRIRIFYKGGHLIESDFVKFNIRIDLEKSFLIDLYDKRSNQKNILRTIGSYVHDSNDDTPSKSLTSIFYTLNINNKLKVPLTIDGKKVGDINSNYVPSPISLEEYYAYAKLFNDEFFEEYGFSIDCFIAFICTLSTHNFLKYIEDIKFQYGMLQRGYTIIESSQFIKAISDIVRDDDYFKNKCLENDSEFQKIFDFLTYVGKPQIDINLWTRGPRKIFIKISENFMIVDYSGFFSLISTIMLPIARISGESGNKKSAHFEIMTNEKIKDIFGQKSHWIGRSEIKNHEKEAKEIDASFCINEFLFILECKSINVSFGFDMGDKHSLEFRKSKLEEALEEVRNKALFLARNKETLNKKLPSGIKYIVPLVVSSFPEYIWEQSEDLFINDDLPRILTIDDLEQIKKTNMESLITKPFTLHLE